MSSEQAYDIGTTGEKWGEAEVAQWLARQQIKRSYQEQVVEKINALADTYLVEQYGELIYPANDYPLYAIKISALGENKPWVLVTGGVHGYETSGVQGAIRFVESKAEQYRQHFNLLVLPCISPWGYETINRWNVDAIDPNRSFYANSPAPESALVMKYVHGFAEDEAHEFIMHIDLHETTDTDNSEFRPALAARDAIVQKTWNIPDGFYLVGDTTKPEADFQKAIVDNVAKVTHIAPADGENKLIGVDLEQFGVINYAARELGLCMGLTDAQFVTTTEVYPDSPLVDDENCILAQVAAVTGGLDYILNQ
ncbi:M14 family metallocarboxypeptidase [Thalassotalea sp. Y01]|uniref:M14 family metallopeptidase n=1 Tax=Thalassotalea sp. Y01 TaxID=2729613 RepID=UPI00145E109B|nr:M14 family metallocarboxypeptidase [Thalassotalea sp. Y01]NMP14962.1 M14 family metallocarboxypeptidase [Thalassotalea sp. Y01]